MIAFDIPLMVPGHRLFVPTYRSPISIIAVPRSSAFYYRLSGPRICKLLVNVKIRRLLKEAALMTENNVHAEKKEYVSVKRYVSVGIGFVVAITNSLSELRQPARKGI